MIPYKYCRICNYHNLNSKNCEENTANRRTISLDIVVYNRLKHVGTFGDSFSDVIAHVLDELDEMKRGPGNNE